MASAEDIRPGRVQWLQLIAEKLDTRGSRRALGLPDDAALVLSTPEIALLTLPRYAATGAYQANHGLFPAVIRPPRSRRQ